MIAPREKMHGRWRFITRCIAEFTNFRVCTPGDECVFGVDVAARVAGMLLSQNFISKSRFEIQKYKSRPALKRKPSKGRTQRNPEDRVTRQVKG